MNITLDHGMAANLLCLEGTVQENLQLSKDYAPLETKLESFNLTIEHSYFLLKAGDQEYGLLESFLQSRESLVIGGEYFHLLNLPNTAADVIFRQEGVRELVSNHQLYHSVGEILKKNPFSSHNHGENYNPKGEVTPEQVKILVNNVQGLETYHPQSGPLQRLISWAEELNQDTFFQELFRQKRSIRDRRIFISASSRFGGTECYLLKPGVRVEEVFDRIDPVASAYEYIKGRRREKTVHRSIVRYRSREDQELTDQVIGQMTAQVNVVNEISARMLGMPVFLTYLQLKHLYVGAYLHRELSERYPMTFPEIQQEPYALDAKGILPVRLVLESTIPHLSHRIKAPLVPNSFRFKEQEVVQIEGPNNSGKSEAWRTLHWSNLLINSGYSLPATSVKSGIVANSHFISCKGSSAYGGSELGLSLRGIEERLREVAAGDQVILDELGDSANAPTALEFGKRIIPVLVSRGCRVLITTQHGALSDYIRENFNGLTLTPDGAYQLKLSEGPVDFKPGEVLDQLGATSGRFEQLVSATPRSFARRKDPVYRADRERERRALTEIDSEDVPF